MPRVIFLIRMARTVFAFPRYLRQCAALRKSRGQKIAGFGYIGAPGRSGISIKLRWLFHSVLRNLCASEEPCSNINHKKIAPCFREVTSGSFGCGLRTEIMLQPQPTMHWVWPNTKPWKPLCGINYSDSVIVNRSIVVVAAFAFPDNAEKSSVWRKRMNAAERRYPW